MTHLRTADLVRWFGYFELLLDSWSTGMVLVDPMGVLLPVLMQWGTATPPQRKAAAR